MNKIIACLFVFLTSLIQASAQTEGVEMAFDMRSSGKIYVVVAVLAVIFVGLASMLVYLDRRVSKLEKQNQKQA